MQWLDGGQTVGTTVERKLATWRNDERADPVGGVVIVSHIEK